MGNLRLDPKYWTNNTPRRVERILKSIRRMIAVAMGTSYLTDNDEWMFIFLILGTAIEEMSNFIGEEIRDGQGKHIVNKTIIPVDDPDGAQTITEVIEPKEE